MINYKNRLNGLSNTDIKINKIYTLFMSILFKDTVPSLEYDFIPIQVICKNIILDKDRLVAFCFKEVDSNRERVLAASLNGTTWFIRNQLN